MFYRKKRPIYVNGVRYSWAGEAVEKLGDGSIPGLAYAARNGSLYKGKYKVVYASEYEQSLKTFNTSKQNGSKSCKVFCETTGKVYPSIEAAAREIGITGWTLSVKMQANGYFKDGFGNIYKRERAMETKNNYASSANITQWGKTLSYRKASDKMPSTVQITSPETTVSAKEVKPKASNENAAVKVLKEQAINFVNKGDYTTAKALLDAISKI